MKQFFFLMALIFASCQTGAPKNNWSVVVVDTDFSKGRLGHVQTITLADLEKFHGHLCDGLVVGALAFEFGMASLQPEGPINRTNFRIISHPSPCLTDVAAYLSGGRYQYNTLVASASQLGVYTIQRLDNLQVVHVALKNGIKPAAIDSLGALATQQVLPPCDVAALRKLEEDFIATLFSKPMEAFFERTTLTDFTWPVPAHAVFQKTDVLNKNLAPCEK